MPPSDAPIDPGFRNIVIPRIGGEYRAVDGEHFGLALRLGYYFEPTPVVDQPAELNYVDTVKHGVSAGFGLRFSEFTTALPKPVLLDFAFQYVGLPRREYMKPAANDPVGDYAASGRFLGFTTSLSFLF